MQKGNTNSGVTKPPVRLSSQITMFTKVLTLLVGLPVSGIIMFQTGYVWWAVIISLFCISFCCAFAYLAVDAHLAGNDFIISGLFETQKRVHLSSLQKIKKFNSKGHTYFYYETPNEKFLILCPMWGDGRKVLYKLYNEFQDNPERVRASFL